MSVKVGINGFGRIGRMITTAAHSDPKCPVEIVAINDPGTPEAHLHLLKYDSVHGAIDSDVRLTKKGLSLDGHEILISQERDPSKINWKKFGVDIVLECTGMFRKRQELEVHLKQGAKYVILASPGPDADATLCIGINQDKFNPKSHRIVSNASCTTNCIAPVAKLLHDNFGIYRGMMTTIHSYTLDQRLLDANHSDLRRARAAALSMIPTTTGATKAVEQVIPELKGRLTGISIRVPTANVSLVDFTASLEKNAKVDQVNKIFKDAASGEMSNILGFTEEPLVSVDFNGCPQSAIIDATLTQSCGDRLVKVFAWYDNETGFSYRMLDLALFMGTKAELV